MTTTLETNVDFKEAMRNPSGTFKTPAALEASSELTDEQKRKILVQWKDQLAQLQAASDENMPGPESDGARAEFMRKISDALIRLDA